MGLVAEGAGPSGVLDEVACRDGISCEMQVGEDWRRVKARVLQDLDRLEHQTLFFLATICWGVNLMMTTTTCAKGTSTPGSPTRCRPAIRASPDSAPLRISAERSTWLARRSMPRSTPCSGFSTWRRLLNPCLTSSGVEVIGNFVLDNDY